MVSCASSGMVGMAEDMETNCKTVRFGFGRELFNSPLSQLIMSIYTALSYRGQNNMWVVVKIMVPFWIPIIIRHLILRASASSKGS